MMAQESAFIMAGTDIRAHNYGFWIMQILVFSLVGFVTNDPVSRRFQQKLNHMALESGQSGDIYVGAVNRLYKFDRDLSQYGDDVITGPKMDNTACGYPFGGSTCQYSGTQYTTTETDNYNKVLLLDEVNSNVIVCGSVFQGTCQIYNSELTSNVSYTDDKDYYLAANDETSSTVAFIDNSALYVGKTFSGKGPSTEIRKQVPTVASYQYSGSNSFKYIAEDDFEATATYLELRDDVKESYLISYVTGFGQDGFSYFLTTQKQTTQADNYISKIVQVCQNDKAFKSYVEIPLICKDQIREYNLVTSAKLITPGEDLTRSLNTASKILVATFVNRDDPDNTKSAVCVYRLESIRQKFTENLQQCFLGLQTNRGDHFGYSETCTKFSGYKVPEGYCGEKGSNSPLAGESSLETEPLVTFTDNTALSAIAVTVVENKYTVAFIGTEQGHLKKVILSATGSREYGDLTLDEGSPVNQDIYLSKDMKHVYVMTQYQMFKVEVQQCSESTSCESCLSSGDPYCGWCSLQRKCSTVTSCENSLKTNMWLTNKDWCIRVTDYQPTQANIHDPQTVTLSVSSLPSQHAYKCVYKTLNGGSVVGEATVTDSGNKIQCLTISDQSGLRIEEGQDHMNLTLAVRSVQTDVDFLDIPFTLYSCSEHSMCSSCTLSRFPCMWCLYDNQCRDESNSCTQDSGTISRDQKELCPAVLTTDIILPSGVAQDVQIRAKNLPSNQNYRCKLYSGSTELNSFPALYTNAEEVVCENLKHAVQGTRQYEVFDLRIQWNSDFDVDGLIKNVTVYNCSNIATDCTSCIVSPSAAYNCAWCQNGGCVYREMCPSPILQTVNCPQAEILSVEPTSFPIDGGSIVTIIGSNIGQIKSDIIAVTLADKPCAVTSYETSRKILCRTSSINSPQQGTVSIEYMDQGNYLQSSIKVHYKDPELVTISPSKGPSSGRSLITITGKSLNTGSNIQIKLGDIPCNIKSKNESTLLCEKVIMENVDNPVTKSSVTVTFDEAERKLTGRLFVLHPDPLISKIEPLKTFRSGGRILTITGTYLDTSSKPSITLNKPGWKSEPSECNQESGSLKCKYPMALSSSNNRRMKRATNNYTISIDIDSVPCMQTISTCFPELSDSVLVYPDPLYHMFNGTRVLEGKTLTLTGKDLNLACTEDEVRVMVGSYRCKVDSLQAEKLLCTPPDDWKKDSPVDVSVAVGNVERQLGKLEFKDPIDQIVWIISSAVGGGTLIFIIIIVIIVYKRRSADVERQNKKLQIQLDNLESNVRNECKQAFAELQTEVSDFTSDLNVIGIPFWDYKMYTFRVLFPGLKSHPVLQNGANSTINKFGGYEQGLHQFNQLLNSKQFLLIFIRTLEQQKNFSIRDKSIVASLLMIVLQDKMEYATEILKSLLNELIDKSVEKKHPKLMLRRTESVVEKLLSNWLSLSMYTYLKKHAGKMLFMLFKAIKHQTEKGPVDVFTSEAKYSLSEDRLLREKVQPQTLNLQVLMSDMKEPVTFRSLDCDTVTQAKEKAVDAVYMNAPFSSRPSVHEMDLEWRSGRSGHLPLQDEDVTTQVINGWKRVNSMSHYHVPDGATLVLVPAKNKNEMIRQVHGMIEITNSQSSLPPIVTVEEGMKVWHLVKHDDNQNIPRTQKVISEIFLTRLLSTKGTLQQYIDDLFMTILRADNGLPPAVKYLFDFLDNAARRHNIVDPEVVHTWKSNSLPLRFWVNIIKNPEFIFDIHKSNIVDSCLSVIAQTFMDSCSTAEHKLGKDSPSNKLLFAKDIPRFRGWVSKFYKGVQDMAPISDQEMTRVMTEMSMTNLTDFNVAVALQDLYKYAMQYNFELLEALDDDPSAKRLHLANRFEQVQAVIEGTPLY